MSVPPANDPMWENVKKCKNFLSTLIKLASNQPPQTVKNVKQLIQGLVVGIFMPDVKIIKHKKIERMEYSRINDHVRDEISVIVVLFHFLLIFAGCQDRSRGLYTEVTSGVKILSSAIPGAFFEGKLCTCMEFLN